jgi:hypothetical protein
MFIVQIKTDNAAFEGDPANEVARILERIQTDLLRGVRSGVCIDLNGNKVGNWGRAIGK